MALIDPKKQKMPHQKTIKSTEDLIKELRQKQQERAEHIALARQAQDTAEQEITKERQEQQYKGNNMPLSEWQHKRGEEYPNKQTAKYMNRYGTRSGGQLSANIRQREIKKRQEEEDKKNPRKRAIKELREKAKEEVKAKIKQKAGQVAQKAGQAAARIAAQAARIIAQALVQATAWLAGAVIATVGTTGLIVIAVILIIVIIIAVIYQTCNDNAISSAICEGVSWVGGVISQIGSWF